VQIAETSKSVEKSWHNS